MQTFTLLAVAALLIMYAAHELALPWQGVLRGLARRSAATPALSSTKVAGATVAMAPAALRRGAGFQRWVSAHLSARVRASAVGGGILLSIVIQEWLGGHPASLAVAVALLCVVGVIVAALLTLSVAPPLLAREVAAAATPRRCPVAMLGATAALVCALLGVAQLGTAVWTAQTLWLAAMALPVLTLLAERLARWWLRRSARAAVEWRDLGLMTLLFGVALAIRLPAITSSPPFVHGDEASCGLFGRIFDTGQAPLLSISWYGLPMLSYAISGLGLHLFGDTLTGLRLINVVVGSVSVVLAYLLGRELFGRRAALLGALVLAVTFLHVDLSRDGIHYIQGPTCITLTLYLLVRWLRRGGKLTAFLAGVSMIVDLQVYWSARIAPLLALGLLLVLAVWERRILAARWREAGWLVSGLMVSGLPVTALFMANPGTFAGHQNEVSVLGNDPYALQVLRSMYGTTSLLPVLLQQAWRIATTFNARGDVSLQIGWGGSMLDRVSAALLPAALLLALVRWRRWQYALCLGWFVAVAGAGILTIPAPWWPRLAALLPAAALLIGVLLAESARLFEHSMPRSRPLVVAGLAVVLVCITIGNLRLVFVDYPAAALQAAPMKPTLLGRFLAHAPGADRTVLLSDGSMYVNYETIRFLAPHAAGCTLMPGAPLSQCALAGNSRLFVLLPGRVGDLAWLQHQRPGGRTVLVGTYEYGSARILAYELPATHSTASRVVRPDESSS
jgi:hypothetical protein